MAIQPESFCADWGLLSVGGNLTGWEGDWAGCMKHLALSTGITGWFLLVDSPTDCDWPVELVMITFNDKLVAHLTDCGCRKSMFIREILKKNVK